MTARTPTPRCLGDYHLTDTNLISSYTDSCNRHPTEPQQPINVTEKCINIIIRVPLFTASIFQKSHWMVTLKRKWDLTVFPSAIFSGSIWYLHNDLFKYAPSVFSDTELILTLFNMPNRKRRWGRAWVEANTQHETEKKILNIHTRGPMEPIPPFSPGSP